MRTFYDARQDIDVSILQHLQFLVPAGSRTELHIIARIAGQSHHIVGILAVIYAGIILLLVSCRQLSDAHAQHRPRLRFSTGRQRQAAALQQYDAQT